MITADNADKQDESPRSHLWWWRCDQCRSSKLQVWSVSLVKQRRIPFCVVPGTWVSVCACKDKERSQNTAGSRWMLLQHDNGHMFNHNINCDMIVMQCRGWTLVLPSASEWPKLIFFNQMIKTENVTGRFLVFCWFKQFMIYSHVTFIFQKAGNGVFLCMCVCVSVMQYVQAIWWHLY